MRKILYLTTWDFSDGPSTGITNKIKGQIKAFKTYGFAVNYTYIADGGVYYHKDNQDLFLGKVGKLRKLAANYYLYKILKEEEYQFVYNRYGLMDLYYFKLLKSLQKSGSRIIIEIPTYPYDDERLPGVKWWLLYSLDKILRNRVSPYVDRIATYSHDEKIFGIPTVEVKNGIDFDMVTVRMPEEGGDVIHMLAVAGFTKAHGYDRMLVGLGKYYQNGGTRKVVFHLVGAGEPENQYRNIVQKYRIEEHCVFHGVKRGQELDQVYNYCDLGVESLGDFRNGIKISSSLKSREYVAKGLPFITACKSDIFEDEEYILQIPADESPVNISDVVNFYDRLYNEKSKVSIACKIRKETMAKCDIIQTMKPIVECFKEIDGSER